MSKVENLNMVRGAQFSKNVGSCAPKRIRHKQKEEKERKTRFKRTCSLKTLRDRQSFLHSHIDEPC